MPLQHPDAGYHPEYHKLYADLQVDLTGSEGWGYTQSARRGDREFYRGLRLSGQCQRSDPVHWARDAVLFFPEELHKPGLAQHGCVSVRKAVVKIRMEGKNG